MNYKKLLLSLSFVFVMVVSAFSQANFQFDKTDHDFSFVREGNDTIWHEFTFKNTGNEPLIISDVKTSCDCTLADWPKEAIQPGRRLSLEEALKSLEKWVILINLSLLQQIRLLR